MELASLHEELFESGWNLTEDGLNSLSEHGKITDTAAIIKKALDVDLRLISKGTLPDDVNKIKYENIPGNIILQIQKIKDLSSPKGSEIHSGIPSLLKLTLTDGVQTIPAIQMENMPSINLNTYPGSKIYLKSKTVDISHSFLLLNSSNTEFLGGKVDSMVEKWELNRSLAKHTRGGIEEGGPPPWIPFGQKITQQTVTDKNFKSLETAMNKDSAENSEFEAQRKGAILEATKIGSAKVFGGGNNKLLDYNVQKIIDAGFAIEEAEYALRICKNNLDRALKHLQAKRNKRNKEENKKSNAKSSGSEEKKSGKGRNKHKDEDLEQAQKPSGKVSLFEFLEEKLRPPEPPVEKRAYGEKKHSNNTFRGHNKQNPKPHFERGKAPGEEKRPFMDRPEMKSQPRRNYDAPRHYGKYDQMERKPYSERKTEFGRFDSKRNFESNPRSDRSFGNFKYSKFEHKNGNSDYNSKSESFKNKSSDKRSQNVTSHSSNRSYNRSFDTNDYKKQVGFTPTCEKPPRFQKYQNQQSESQMSNIQNWNDQAYNRMPESDYQLQNSLANLTLQPNVVNFQSQNPQENYGDLLTGVSAANAKQSNVFYQNVVMPTSPTGDTRVYGNRSNQPPTAPQSHLNTYPGRNATGYLQEVKSSNFSTMPNLQEVAFKSSAPMLHGYNDFQSIFAQAARAPANNFANPQFITSQNGIPAPTHKPWIWKKGDKCMARYWEDQMFYDAVVTAVSENTCVVKFTDYGNYEEVLQDHCYPITEDS